MEDDKRVKAINLLKENYDKMDALTTVCIAVLLPTDNQEKNALALLKMLNIMREITTNTCESIEKIIKGEL